MDTEGKKLHISRVHLILFKEFCFFSLFFCHHNTFIFFSHLAYFYAKIVALENYKTSQLDDNNGKQWSMVRALWQ